MVEKGFRTSLEMTPVSGSLRRSVLKSMIVTAAKSTRSNVGSCVSVGYGSRLCKNADFNTSAGDVSV
jgi:hypothetical protein